MRNLISFLQKSRNIKNLISRAITILQRFSLSPKRLENILLQYVELLQKFNLSPSFPVTAIVVKRYPETIKKLQNKGANLAIHGYTHIDYPMLPLPEIQKHLAKAKEIFSTCNISFTGFRAPYARWNNLQMLKDSNFSWDSSQTILWNTLAGADSNRSSRPYLKAINLYNPLNADTSLSLPYFPIPDSDFIEIPLSLPDDEMLIDRLKIKSKEEIKKIWEIILQKTYKKGELFTLQLHHERFPLCKSAIESLLKTSKALPVWLASLEQIAQWWTEKMNFTAELDEKNTTIKFNCSPRATILLRNITTPIKTENWSGSYQTLEGRNQMSDVRCQMSDVRPVIGVKDCSYEFISFLKQQGYIIDKLAWEQNNKNDYAFYFENVTEFNKLELIAQIENSDKPLVRFWRWPDKKRSAFSITGDIDALTLFDFFARMFGK